MPVNLPQGITLGHLLSSFKLGILSPVEGASDQDAQKIGNYALHVLQLGGDGGNEHVLPFPGWIVRITPQESILQAELYPSPELTVDPDIPGVCTHLTRPEGKWSDFCVQVENWLEREQGRILVVCEELFLRLTQALSFQHGQSAVRDLKDILGYDVFLLDNQLDIVEWAGGKYLPEKPIPFLPPEITSKLSAASSVRFVSLFPGSWKDSTCQIPLTWCPVAGQTGILGHLGLAVSREALDSVEYYFIHKAATLLALELLKNQSIRENERLHHRDFLFDLLYNNFDSLEVIISRGKLWGWDFSKPHLVMVGEIEDFASLPAERQRLSELVDQAIRSIRSIFPGAICLERNNQIVLLFPLKDVSAKSLLPAVAEQFLKPVWKAADNLFAGRRLFFGLGNLYPSAREIHRSFQEARSAVELGRLLFPHKLLTAFGELGIMRLLQRLDHQELEDYRLEILKPVLEFDREANLELEHTLLTYFLCNGDLNLAAQQLFLHPNTLRYRIKKAAEVLERDISRLDHQLNLFIALQIGHLKALWSE